MCRSSRFQIPKDPFVWCRLLNFCLSEFSTLMQGSRRNMLFYPSLCSASSTPSSTPSSTSSTSSTPPYTSPITFSNSYPSNFESKSHWTSIQILSLSPSFFLPTPLLPHLYPHRHPSQNTNLHTTHYPYKSQQAWGNPPFPSLLRLTSSRF